MSRAVTRMFAKASLVAVFLAALAGCTSGVDEVEQWVRQEKAKKGQPLQPPPVIKTFESFEYTLRAPEDRDPFNVPMDKVEEEEKTAGPRPDKNRTPEPLEAFPLDGLKMVGTLGSPAAPEGLLKDPEGVIRRVKPGDYVGQNYGRITAINESQIELVELVANDTGGWAERHATIALADANKK
ncbi:MAG: pilus assembly protein PilP [Xanthomonadales bacterium]|nr:pilus assembly protein PilP [Xanthomonadales bacterium]